MHIVQVSNSGPLWPSCFLKTQFLCVNIFQPVGDDTEDCRIELEPRSGVLEPREENSITVHFIANRTVGICVMEKSITVHFIANRTVGICVIERIVELSWNPEVECWNPGRRNQSLYTL